MITKTWLGSLGDPPIEEALTQPYTVEAILQMFASTDVEILELIISI